MQDERAAEAAGQPLTVVENLVLGAREWVVETTPALIEGTLVVVVLMGGFWVVSRLARAVVKRAVASSRLDISDLMRDFLVETTAKAILLIGALVTLSQIGVEVGPMIAGLGVAGLVVGFALQDSLSNFAAGMMILFYHPFDVGDFVEAGGVTGQVGELNLVNTKLVTPDNQVVIVPNGKVWGDIIVNRTSQATRRVDLTFGIGYDDDIEQAERVLSEIVAGHELVLAEPAPVVKLHALGDSSVDFVVRPWVATENYWAVYWDLTREVKRRFDEEGISIPYPQRDLHLHGEIGKA